MTGSWIRNTATIAAGLACVSVLNASDLKKVHQKTPCPTGVLQNSCFGYFPVTWKPWPAGCAYVEFGCDAHGHASSSSSTPVQVLSSTPHLNATSPVSNAVNSTGPRVTFDATTTKNSLLAPK